MKKIWLEIAQISPTDEMDESQKVFSRWMAAGLHLLISVLIAVAVIVSMFFLWYPSPYFKAMGGTGLLQLLVGVDVVLGPLITLIIFNTKKKSLKFDLLCVAVVQIIALTYGVSTMFEARPVYTVFNDSRFDVVIAADMNADEREKVKNPLFRSLPMGGPLIVGMEMPSDKAELERVFFSGMEARSFAQYYVTYNSKAKEAAKASKPITEWQKNHPDTVGKLKAFLAAKAIDETKVGFLPLYTRNEDMTVVLDRETGKILAIAPIAP